MAVRVIQSWSHSSVTEQSHLSNCSMFTVIHQFSRFVAGAWTERSLGWMPELKLESFAFKAGRDSECLMYFLALHLTNMPVHWDFALSMQTTHFKAMPACCEISSKSWGGERQASAEQSLPAFAASLPFSGNWCGLAFLMSRLSRGKPEI